MDGDCVSRSDSVLLSQRSVVERVFKMARHASKKDRELTQQKYQRMSDFPCDAERNSTPSVWEEEVFVTCASFRDVDDDSADQDEASLACSIRILDGNGENAKLNRDLMNHFNTESFTDNMDMLCVSKNDVIDDAKPVDMDSKSWEQIVNGEMSGDSKLGRFGWFLASSKDKPLNGSSPSERSDTSVDTKGVHPQEGVEMVLCGKVGAGAQTTPKSKSKKGTSAWYPRLVRRTRVNEKVVKQSGTTREIDGAAALEDLAPKPMDILPVDQEPVSTNDLAPNEEQEGDCATKVLKSTEENSGSDNSDRSLQQADEEWIAKFTEANEPTVCSLNQDMGKVDEAIDKKEPEVGIIRVVSTSSLRRSFKSTSKQVGADTRSISSRSSFLSLTKKLQADSVSVSSRRSTKSTDNSRDLDVKSVSSRRSINSSRKQFASDSASVSSRHSDKASSIANDERSSASRSFVHASVKDNEDDIKSVSSRLSIKSVASRLSLQSKSKKQEAETRTVASSHFAEKERFIEDSKHNEAQTGEEATQGKESEEAVSVGDNSEPTIQSKTQDKPSETPALKDDSEKAEEVEKCPSYGQEEKELREEPLRRFVSEVIPSRGRLDNTDEEEEDIEKEELSKFNMFGLRRTSSDIPKSNLESKQHSIKKGSKPIEVSGHLLQPCPSDITDYSDEGECNSILNVVSSRDEGMETIEECKGTSEHEEDNEEDIKDSVYEGNNDSKEKRIEIADGASEKGSVDNSGEDEQETEPKGQDNTTESIEDESLHEEHENNKSKSVAEACEKVGGNGFSFSAGVFDYVMRRISSDVQPCQSNAEESNCQHSIFKLRKSRSEIPGRSSAAVKYAKNAKPLDMPNASVKTLEETIARVSGTEDEKVETLSSSQVEEHQVAVDSKKEDDKIAPKVTNDASVTASRSNAHAPSIIGSLGSLFAKSEKQKKTIEKEDEAESVAFNSASEDGLNISGETDVDSNPEDESISEDTAANKAAFEAIKEDSVKETSTSEQNKHIQDLSVRKKSTRGFKFWKRNIQKESTVSSPSKTVEESKFECEEDCSRGGGSEREGPSSEKTCTTSIVGSLSAVDQSFHSNEQVKPQQALLMKLKSIPVPEVSYPKFERPVSQEEGLKQMQSLRDCDPAEMEKWLDKKLSTPQSTPRSEDQENKSLKRDEKKKELEGILKKNNRFSTKKNQKADDVKLKDQDNSSVDGSYCVVLSSEARDGGETGFEIMSNASLSQC